MLSHLCLFFLCAGAHALSGLSSADVGSNAAAAAVGSAASAQQERALGDDQRRRRLLEPILTNSGDGAQLSGSAIASICISCLSIALCLCRYCVRRAKEADAQRRGVVVVSARAGGAGGGAFASSPARATQLSGLRHVQGAPADSAAYDDEDGMEPPSPPPPTSPPPLAPPLSPPPLAALAPLPQGSSAAAILARSGIEARSSFESRNAFKASRTRPSG